jgi:hypothetical protein
MEIARSFMRTPSKVDAKEKSKRHKIESAADTCLHNLAKLICNEYIGIKSMLETVWNILRFMRTNTITVIPQHAVQESVGADGNLVYTGKIEDGTPYNYYDVDFYLHELKKSVHRVNEDSAFLMRV